MKYVLDHTGMSYRKFFEDICAIPHETFNEKEIAEYIVDFAKERGLWYYIDDIWNVIIKKAASPGYETHPPVMIQGHTDMVCEKAPGSTFNFDTDPLQLYVEDGLLKARDTTLGADCGHGIAYMLAILDDTELKHPPIEAFFSVQEESGIGGPKYVDYSLFSAKRLINTDMMTEGATYLSTGSVVGGYFFKPLAFCDDNVKPVYKAKVAGLTGGHAGIDIIKDRANAIKIAARVLFNIMKEAEVYIADIKGGTIKNNIPTECEIWFASDGKEEMLRAIAGDTEKEVKIEYADTDENLYITITREKDVKRVIDASHSTGLIDTLQAVTTGVFMQSHIIQGFATGSRNMGTVAIENGKLKFGYMFRSAYKHLISYYMDQILTTMKYFNAEFEEEYRYSGFNTTSDTPLCKVYAQVYKEKSGKDLQYHYIHGGTDVGTIADNIEGIDVIAIGPDTFIIHRPGESLDIASFDRTYQYFIKILEAL